MKGKPAWDRSPPGVDSQARHMQRVLHSELDFGSCPEWTGSAGARAAICARLTLQWGQLF